MRYVVEGVDAANSAFRGRARSQSQRVSRTALTAYPLWLISLIWVLSGREHLKIFNIRNWIWLMSFDLDRIWNRKLRKMKIRNWKWKRWKHEDSLWEAYFFVFAAFTNKHFELREQLHPDGSHENSFSWSCFPGVVWTRFFSPHRFPGFWDSIPKRCKGVHCVDLGESFRNR